MFVLGNITTHFCLKRMLAVRVKLMEIVCVDFNTSFELCKYCNMGMHRHWPGRPKGP